MGEGGGRRGVGGGWGGGHAVARRVSAVYATVKLVDSFQSGPSN